MLPSRLTVEPMNQGVWKCPFVSTQKLLISFIILWYFYLYFLVPKVASSCFPETVLMKHDYIALIHCCPIEEIQCNYNGIYYYRKCNSAHKKMSTNYSVFFISVFLIDRSGLWDHKGLTVTTLLDIWYECSMFALLLKYIIIQFYRELIS